MFYLPLSVEKSQPDCSISSRRALEERRNGNLVSVDRKDFLTQSSRGDVGRSHSGDLPQTPEEALKASEHAISLDQEDAEAWRLRGWALGQLGHFEEALGATEIALRLDPESSAAWRHNCWELVELGRFSEALESIRRALELDPEDAEAWRLRGWVFREQGRYEESLQAFDRSLELDPEDADSWTNKGTTLGRLGRYEEAVAAHGKAIELDPQIERAWGNRGWALGQLGRFSEALDATNKALELDPRDAVAWRHNGWILGKLGQFKESLNASERAIEIDPQDFHAWSNKALALQSMGRIEEAAAARDAARSLSLKQEPAEKGSIADSEAPSSESLPIEFESGEESRPPSRAEVVETQWDDPALVDRLGRRPFARILAARLNELWAGPEGKVADEGPPAEKTEDKSFTVHIHGPWGAGKTSILNFLRKELQDRDPFWIVVEFNAWLHQRTSPPWWALIMEVQRQSREQLAKKRSRWALNQRWFCWRLRADWLPVVLALGGIALLVWPVFWSLQDGIQASSWRSASTIVTSIVALIGGVAALVAASRSMLFGSRRAAKTYLLLSRDPLRPIVELFGKLVKSLKRPVVIFIDDLDRCSAEYTVDLLDGIQTLFKDTRVAYVIAADRKWIRLSFESRFEGFKQDLGEPGRPLGNLFLDKLFQLSVSVPNLSVYRQKEYFDHLLGSAIEEQEGWQEAAHAKAQEQLSEVEKSEESLRHVIESEENDPLLRAALAEEAAVLISTPEGQRATEHQLQPFAHLLERNPRSMKRLLNAYGIRQALNLLEVNWVDSGPLTLWTIVELRWPLLADYLSNRPEQLSLIGKKRPENTDLPEELAELFMSHEVKSVVQGDGLDEHVKLTSEAIRRIVGLQSAKSAFD